MYGIKEDIAIIYKSQYAKACDLIGIKKPKTQEEEDYCQEVEFEHPETAAKVLSDMLKVRVTQKMIPNTHMQVFKKIKSWIK